MAQFTFFPRRRKPVTRGDHEELDEEQWTSRTSRGMLMREREGGEENVKSLADRVTPLKLR